jgi:hypothetical protein
MGPPGSLQPGKGAPLSPVLQLIAGNLWSSLPAGREDVTTPDDLVIRAGLPFLSSDLV